MFIQTHPCLLPKSEGVKGGERGEGPEGRGESMGGGHKIG